MAQIETVIFDMGNVLVDFSHERACMQLAVEAGVSARRIKEVLFDSGLEMEYEAGRHTTEELHRRLETDLGVNLDLQRMLHAASDIFTAKPEMEALAAEIRARGFRLVLLSNVNVAHFTWIRERYGFPKLFDELVLSYEVGVCKPEAGIYAAAVRAAGVVAERCFFIDDVAANIAAARGAGIVAHHFTDIETLRPDLRHHGIIS